MDLINDALGAKDATVYLTAVWSPDLGIYRPTGCYADRAEATRAGRETGELLLKVTVEELGRADCQP